MNFLAHTTKKRKPFFTALISAFFIVPCALLAAPPVGFPVQQIWFSKEPFFADEIVTVSVLLVNGVEGTLSGTVIFLDNEKPIGTRSFALSREQVVSVLTVDLVATEGVHRIRAEIRNATLLVNGTARPVSLGTSIAETEDIMIDRDTDGDGAGNATDSDDDDDMISDTEEARLGTNPLKKDSDGDGVSDPDEIKAGTVERPVATTTRIVNETIDRYVPQAIREVAAPAAGVLERARVAGAYTVAQYTDANRERIVELRELGDTARTTPPVLTTASSTASTTAVAVKESVLPPRLETPFRYVYWGLLTLAGYLFSITMLYYAVVALGAFWVVRGIVRFIRRRRAV